MVKEKEEHGNFGHSGFPGPHGYSFFPGPWSKFRLFSCDFQEEAEASEGLALEEIFLNGISQFGKIVSLAIAHFVFFSPSSWFVKSERGKGGFKKISLLRF